MRAHHDPKQSTDEAASDSTPANSPPSRKRLLIPPNPNPNPCSTASSALSSDGSSDQFCRKTRDLPNLSDCHSCGLRINNTDPKDKLQTLDSVWRIVLLCKKCIKLVQSAQLCSYCFSEASSEEQNCFRCRDCDRRVHKDCVLEYSYSSPWSYCSVESGFSVCIDCWVPELLANSRRIYKKKSNRKSVAGDSRKSLTDVANEAKCALQKKIAAASEAKENAVRKAAVAKRAVEFANGAVDLVAKKDGSDGKSESLVSSCSAAAAAPATTVVDDAELAFRLHRAMNSSPRISRNLCPTNFSRVDALKMLECNGNLSSRGKIMVCRKNKLMGSLDRNISGVRASDDGSCGLVYTRKLGNMENGEIVFDVGSGGDSGVNSESESSQKQDGFGNVLHPNGTRQLDCDGNDAMLHDGRCNGNGKPLNNLLKYRRRALGSKAVPNKTKFIYEGLNLESEYIGPVLQVYCSKRRKFLSDASAQSCAVPVQATTWLRDSS